MRKQIKRMKSDELRFRHAADRLGQHATIDEVAAEAGVPMHRAGNLWRRLKGGSVEPLPPLPEPPAEDHPAETISAAPEIETAEASPSEDPGTE